MKLQLNQIIDDGSAQFKVALSATSRNTKVLQDKINQATANVCIASEDNAGIMKLYNETGNNTDGTVTQRFINNNIQNLEALKDQAIEQIAGQNTEVDELQTTVNNISDSINNVLNKNNAISDISSEIITKSENVNNKVSNNVETVLNNNNDINAIKNTFNEMKSHVDNTLSEANISDNLDEINNTLENVRYVVTQVGSNKNGIKLANVENVSIIPDNKKVSINWTDPEDLIYDDIVLARWLGTLLVRKEGSMPLSYKDGVTVLDSNIRNEYTTKIYEDTNLTNDVTYYYRFFPYTENSFTVGTSVAVTPKDKRHHLISTKKNTYYVITNKHTTFDIETVGSGNIIVESDNDNVDVTVNGKTINILGMKNGTTTLTIHQDEDDVFFPSNKLEISIIVDTISSTLNDNSWEDIANIAHAGKGELYWDIGDSKEILLNGNIGSNLSLARKKVKVFILDFNYAETGLLENNIIFGCFKDDSNADIALCDNLLGQTINDGTICFNMNHTSQIGTPTGAGYNGTNFGGWKGSDLRYDILGATSIAPSMYNRVKSNSNIGYNATTNTLSNPKENTLLAAMPEDLRSVIKLWTRYIDAVGNQSNSNVNIKETIDAITLLNESEMSTDFNNSNQYESNFSKILRYYANGNSIIKYDFNNNPVEWWLSSPASEDAYSYCSVDNELSLENVKIDNANVVKALAPAFKI